LKSEKSAGEKPPGKTFPKSSTRNSAARGSRPKLLQQAVCKNSHRWDFAGAGRVFQPPQLWMILLELGPYFSGDLAPGVSVS
jgi:hypothetical protein